MKKKTVSELAAEYRNDVPILTHGIGTRINAIAGKVGGKVALAKSAGLSESQLHRIVAGESQPKIEAVAAMAKAAGVSVGWLATGESPMTDQALDVLEELVREVEERLLYARATISPSKKAVLIRLLFEEKLKGQGKPAVPDSFAKYLKLVS
jgi:transcriptional regulator with XRE-family HTH domain